ncbi:MAG TPA: bifunctional 5,10-methylenetetrahydrofolate dehydrogenase/5,10-methenyltetrahydrofolate cyclohydrolase [Candidatus Saccharimonadales bacterium]|nr:bifunctional 5,10-methylenetetrahydrofolate dehydrogenase/5,10-methenyltetrahydrofolate cyclohydrolase [Candidatus Saccharimonadales bacterium]
MRIDGRALADNILADLKTRVEELQKKHDITPHLAVVRVGYDPAITSYVNQKEKTAQKIGAQFIGYQYPETVTEQELFDRLVALDTDPNIHGLILQLPIPKHLNQQKLLLTISPEKDVDGFHPNSKFIVPTASAVLTILEHIFSISEPLQEKTYLDWLNKQQIIIIGKGKTAGQPMIDLLKSKNISPIVIDSKTDNPQQQLKNADIIISAVGKKDMVKKEMVKPGAILISIGLDKGEDGKFYGDYDNEDVQDIAGFYTPVPGGVGPVNVAKLMENLVQAAENSLQ